MNNDFDIDENTELQFENLLPYTNIKYGNSEYWDEWYKNNLQDFEWYLSWDNIRDEIINYLPKKGTILEVGCGTSEMTSELSKEGYNKIYAIDISRQAIEQMKDIYQSNQNITWNIGDISKTGFPSNSFDIIFEKATLDSILCENGVKKATQSLSEIIRILKPNGMLFSITKEKPPHFLINDLLKRYDDEQVSLVQTKKIKKQTKNEYYIYILKKGI